MNIILLGMKHCGKTSAGLLLSQRRRCPFFDLDEEIVNTYEAEYGKRKRVDDIVRQDGAGVFDTVEAHALDRVRAEKTEFVLALGGRTPLNPLVAGSLPACGFLIYINTPLTLIMERIMKDTRTTLVDAEDPNRNIRLLFEMRRETYMAAAQAVVNGNCSIEELVTRLEICIEENPDGR
jgi:shikimate kinase